MSPKNVATTNGDGTPSVAESLLGGTHAAGKVRATMNSQYSPRSAAGTRATQFMAGFRFALAWIATPIAEP